MDKLVDNCYGDARLPGSAQELRDKLHELRKARYSQEGSKRTRIRIGAELGDQIRQKTGNRCHICGGGISGSYWEADHICPAAARGDNSMENFLPAHGLCNTVKSDHRGEEFQWVLRIGVWAKKQMETKGGLGDQMLKLFFEQEQRRVRRQRANGPAAVAEIYQAKTV